MTTCKDMTDSRGKSWSYVPETRFGQWFLRTNIWAVHVLRRAINDLDRILTDRERTLVNLIARKPAITVQHGLSAVAGFVRTGGRA